MKFQLSTVVLKTRKSLKPVLLVKSSVEHILPMDILINSNTCLLYQVLSTNKPNVKLFPWFFTNHGFVILAPPCNLNLYGLSPILHQSYLTTPKLFWVLQLWLDSFICGLASFSCGYFGKFDLFLYVNVKICNLFSFWYHC